jgi:hypothetical protein
MNWISVKDRLPKEGRNVILYDGEEVFCGCFEMDAEKKPCWGNQACDGVCYGWYEKNEIKYWMPLPNPPEKLS